MMRRVALCLTLVMLAALATGCGPIAVVTARLVMPDTTTMKAEYTIGTQSVVVIPFRDSAKGYFESNDGIDLAEVVTGELVSRKAAVNVRSCGPVRAKYAGQNLELIGWPEVANAAGADLVLLGDIQEFRLKDPGALNLFHGYSRIGIRIIDAKKNCVVYQSPVIETWCPDFGTATYAPGIPAADTTPERVRRGLISATAMKVVQRLYTWEKPIGAPQPGM